MTRLTRLTRILSLTAPALPLLVACSSSTPPATATPFDAGVDADMDSGASMIPDTSACAGDASHCLAGTLSTALFSVTPGALKVELYRVFPSGSIAPIKSAPVAKDGTFAFSNLDAWGHYYLKGIAGFGTSADAVSVGALVGRFSVPSAGTPIALSLAPVAYEVLETGSGANRRGQWVSAHVFDPATGKELTDATVSFSSGATTTPMPYATNVGGTKSYFVQLATPVALTPPTKLQVSHAALGGTPLAVTLTTEAEAFSTVAISSPTDGATVPANQPLAITWVSPPSADYMLVALFAKMGAPFTSRFTSTDSIAPDTTMATVPASALSPAGAYLLNVNGAKALCGTGAGGGGCAYLLQAGSASLTAQ